MRREDYIREKIQQSGYTVKEFAQKISMPYSTLLSILKGAVGGAAVDNILKICAGLGLTIGQLQDAAGMEEASDFWLNDREKELVVRYRDQKAMQPAVDRLLGLDIGESGVEKGRVLHVVSGGAKPAKASLIIAARSHGKRELGEKFAAGDSRVTAYLDKRGK